MRKTDWDRPPWQALRRIPVLLSQDEYFLLGDNRENSGGQPFCQCGKCEKARLKGKGLAQNPSPYAISG